jgi:hypothetical protein
MHQTGKRSKEQAFIGMRSLEYVVKVAVIQLAYSSATYEKSTESMQKKHYFRIGLS